MQQRYCDSFVVFVCNTITNQHSKLTMKYVLHILSLWSVLLIVNSCTLNVGLFGHFKGKETKTFRKALKWIDNKTYFPGGWKLNVKVISINATSRETLEYAENQMVWKLEKIILQNELSLVVGPNTATYFEMVHPPVTSAKAFQVFPKPLPSIYDDDSRFPNLIHIKPVSSWRAESIWNLTQYYDHKNLTILVGSDVDGLNTVEHIRQCDEENKMKIRAIFIQKGDSLKTVLRKTAKRKPHAILISAKPDLAYSLITEAYILNMTVGRGWMWMVDDDISNRKVEKIRTQNGSAVYFDGLIGFQQRNNVGSLFQQNLNYYLESKFNNSDLYQIKMYLAPIAALSATLNASCNMQNPQHQVLSNLHKFTAVQPSLDTFDVVCSKQADWTNIGALDTLTGLTMDRKAVLETVNSLHTFFLRITTIVETPFVFPSPSNSSILRGYCVDLLEEWSKSIGFTYSLRLVADGQYGGINSENGSWNGMIGEVERGEVDVAIGSITITEARSQVGVFLPAFLDLKLKFLIQRYLTAESDYEYSAFAFLYTFDTSVYHATLISVVLVSVFLVFLSKVSPYGIRGRFFHTSKSEHRVPRRMKLTKSERKLKEERSDANRGMGLNNALYFVWAALFWQTPERVPRSISARVISVTWYLVAVILVANFTANLVGVVLRHDPKLYTINSIEDLLLQDQVGFGTVENSAVETQLETSRSKMGGQLFSWLENHPDQIHHVVQNVSAGLQLVEKGIFALLWDSISLDYISAVQSNCSLKTVDVGFGAIKYAFFINKDSPHYNVLAKHLQQLQERGFLDQLWQKYFQGLEGCNYLGISVENSFRPLTFSDLAGVFYFVFIAMGVGIIVLTLEWLVVCFYDVKASDPIAPQSIWEAFRRRRQRLYMDIKQNWNPFGGCLDKFSKLELPSLDAAEDLVSKRVNTSRRFAERKSTNLRRSKSLDRW